MAGGFLSGLVAGAAVSGVALAALSVAVGPQTVPAPAAVAVEVPGGSGFSQARDDTAARLPGADGAPDLSADAPQVGALSPDDLSQVDSADTQPTLRPDIGAPGAELSAPQPGDDDSGMPGTGATEDVPPMPGAAEEEAVPSISADPAQPSQPEVETGAAFAPSSDSATSPDAPPTALPDAADARPAGSAPARTGTIADRAEGVETSRLPSVGSTGARAFGREDSASQSDLPMIEAHAEPFENPANKPLMSIVLIDDGSSPIGLDALAAFPYPLSFAVDAAWPGARDAMRRYRDAGFEVLAIADLPEGATAGDTETVMQTARAAVPEAVAIIEGTGNGLQAGREASGQLAPILKETGQGLVLFSKGLETAPKLIAREGVPVGTVFRDFDAGGESAAAIRRVLDQAAFKAGRDTEGVIMLGRLRADTISALLLWGLQDRASRVALAPVSAILTGSD